jgi:hypothetical protein
MQRVQGWQSVAKATQNCIITEHSFAVIKHLNLFSLYGRNKSRLIKITMLCLWTSPPLNLSWHLGTSPRRTSQISRISLCVCMYTLLGNGWLKTLPRQRIHRLVALYAVRVVSKETLWVCLWITLSFLGNDSVNTFPRKRGVGVVDFYAVFVASNESPWNSC